MSTFDQAAASPTASQPARQPQRSRNAHHLDIAAPGAFPRYVYQLRGHSLGPPHAREPWQMPPKADAQAMPPNLDMISRGAGFSWQPRGLLQGKEAVTRAQAARARRVLRFMHSAIVC